MGGDKNNESKIFVGAIAQQTTTESLRKHFEQYGIITDCIVMSDPTSGRSRGFGFVTFDSAESVDKILAVKQVLDGKEVDCKRACPRESMDSKRGASSAFRTDKIFVGGLPDMTPEEFTGYFEKYGKIVDSVLMKDKESGRPRGFGFITFDSFDAVDEVVRKYNDHSIKGKWIEVKRAHPKDQQPNRDGRFGGMGNQGYPGGSFDPYYNRQYGGGGGPYDRRGGAYGQQGGGYSDPYAQAGGYSQQSNPRGGYSDPYNMRSSQGYTDPYSQGSPSPYAPNGSGYSPPGAIGFEKAYAGAYGAAGGYEKPYGAAGGYANGAAAAGAPTGYSASPAAVDPYSGYSVYSQFGAQRGGNRSTANRAYPY